MMKQERIFEWTAMRSLCRAKPRLQKIRVRVANSIGQKSIQMSLG